MKHKLSEIIYMKLLIIYSNYMTLFILVKDIRPLHDILKLKLYKLSILDKEFMNSNINYILTKV